MVYFADKKISLALQMLDLKSTYPKLIDGISIKNGELCCDMRLQPFSDSDIYRVRIKYKLGERPRAWILSPKIEKFNGEYPIHRYGFDASGHIELCVYYPEYNEWDDKHMFLSEAFIPWVVTWLKTYEFWLATGTWNYNEKHPKFKKVKKQ